MWRPTSVKTCNFFLCDFNRATTPVTTVPIFFYRFFFFFLFSLPILLFHTSIMCFQYIPVVSQKRSYIKHRRQRNLAHLRSIYTSSSLPFSFSMGLWNCQSTVNKADLIPAIASQTALWTTGPDWDLDSWIWQRLSFLSSLPLQLYRMIIFWWPADFQRPHCKNCSILQVCTTQHQKDQAFPYTARCTTFCPGPCHF